MKIILLVSDNRLTPDVYVLFLDKAIMIRPHEYTYLGPVRSAAVCLHDVFISCPIGLESYVFVIRPEIQKKTET